MGVSVFIIPKNNRGAALLIAHNEKIRKLAREIDPLIGFNYIKPYQRSQLQISLKYREPIRPTDFGGFFSVTYFGDTIGKYNYSQLGYYIGKQRKAREIIDKIAKRFGASGSDFRITQDASSQGYTNKDYARINPREYPVRTREQSLAERQRNDREYQQWKNRQRNSRR